MDIPSFSLSVFLCCCLFIPIRALFTVQAMKPLYTAEYGSDVTLECQFTVKRDTKLENTTVIWKHQTDKDDYVEVAKYFNGKNADILQDKEYSDRVKLLSQELYRGCAMLHISNVKVTDAGQYLCIISSQGSDYKPINLEVKALYKHITPNVTDVVTSSGKIIKEISCQSVGYPEAEVTWLNDSGSAIAAYNKSYLLTTERLFNITSVIRVSSAVGTTFTCIFWNKAFNNGTSLAFTIPETNRNNKHYEWIYATTLFAVILVLAPIIFLIHGYLKGRFKKKITEYNSMKPSTDNSATTSPHTEDNPPDHDDLGNT